MRPEALINRAAKLERRKALTDLLAAIEGLPKHKSAALMARIMKDIVAGKITAAEANEIRKAVKI